MAYSKDPFLGLTMADVAKLSHKDYLFYRAIQRAQEREAKEQRRRERNAHIEAHQAKRQERNAKFERPRDPDAAARYEADRQRAKQARFAELEARADAVFANYNEGDE